MKRRLSSRKKNQLSRLTDATAVRPALLAEGVTQCCHFFLISILLPERRWQLPARMGVLFGELCGKPESFRYFALEFMAEGMASLHAMDGQPI